MVILPIGDVRCGGCGFPMQQMRLDRLGLAVEAQCWSDGCDNYRKVVRLDAPTVEAPEVTG